MPHLVTDNCDGCRFTDCVTVCPVECFHADEARMYIDPEVCIDCGACIPACPVHAIYEAIDVPEDQRRWIALNAERAARLPLVLDKQEPLPTAEARRAALGFAGTT
jgi:ferredoxin